MNIDTGKFDLSKFNSSLKSMGTDLNKVKTIEQVEDYFKTYQIDYLPKQAIKRIIK